MSIRSDKFKIIADRIRAKLGITDLIAPNDFADKVDEVYDKGVQDEYDRFWDAFQENGKKTDYAWAFYDNAWADETFKPKYDIKPSNGEFIRMFEMCNITDLRGILEKQSIILDTSAGGNMTNMFTSSSITRLPEINLKKVNAVYNIFYGCTDLVSIQKIIINDVAPNYFASKLFTNCESLEEFELEGTIFNSISFQYSPLNLETAINVINCLENYKGTENEYTYTLTLSASTKALLDAAGETSPEGTTWSDYISSLGWNLV